MVGWAPKATDALSKYWISLVGGQGEGADSPAASAKLTIPIVTLEGVKQAAEMLHELANALARQAAVQPGDPRNDDLIRLGMARQAVYLAQAEMRALKKREIDTIKDMVAAEKTAEIHAFGRRG